MHGSTAAQLSNNSTDTGGPSPSGEVGILSMATHLPGRRLQRELAVRAMSWYAPGLAALKGGTRSVCHFDEDPVTMAVAAADRALQGQARADIDALFLASTTLPFDDRAGGGLIATALGLDDSLFCADITDTQAAGTRGLITALERVRGAGGTALVAATDQRLARPGAPEELLFGDGAAAAVVGAGDPIAVITGHVSITRDLVDHYRARGERFDYGWEERWSAAVGYETLIPEAVDRLLTRRGMTKDDIDTFVYPCPSKRGHRAIGRKLGISDDKIADNLFDTVGETGVAHPLVMLASVLETARPGARIVVVGFGGGADALLLEVTEAILTRRPRHNPLPPIPLTDYTQFLAFRELIAPETGVRGEKPQKTALSVLYRERELLTGLVGGRCDACGTPQIPSGPLCVNPSCRASDSQAPYRFAHRTATLKTFTGDYLYPSPCPPSLYGLIQFDGGGRMMAELTDCTLDSLAVGTRLKMSFRKRYHDHERGFTGYFWKAVPAMEEAP